MPVMLHCLALLGPLNLWVCGVSWLLWEPKSLDKLWSRATWFLWVKRNADFAPPPVESNANQILPRAHNGLLEKPELIHALI